MLFDIPSKLMFSSVYTNQNLNSNKLLQYCLIVGVQKLDPNMFLTSTKKPFVLRSFRSIESLQKLVATALRNAVARVRDNTIHEKSVERETKFCDSTEKAAVNMTSFKKKIDIVNIFKDVHIGVMVDTIFQSDVTIRLCEQWYLRKTSATATATELKSVRLI